MLKITKISATILVFYILFYLQIFGDNHLILYGSAIITVLSMVIYCIRENYLDLNNVPFGVWNNLIMVAYSIIVGSFVAYNYSRILSSSVTLAAYSVVCIAICYVSYEEKSFNWVLNMLIALAGLSAVYAFFRGAVWEGYGKTLSLNNNPHFFAAVMNLGTFSIIFRIKDAEKRVSILWIVLIGFFLYSIIGCGSRKYLIATSLMLIVWIITSVKERWAKGDTQQKVTTILMLFCIAILVYFIYRRFYINSDSYSRMMDSDDLGNQKRILFYRKALEIFLDHPVFGGGYDQFRYWSGVGGYAHSTYAEAIADFGFLGCVLYFSPIIYTTFYIIKKPFYCKMNYKSLQLLTFCIAELFIGVGQIFFMEFHHFVAWTILFYYSHEQVEIKEPTTLVKTPRTCKYIR